MTWAFLKPMKLAPKLSIIDFPSSVAGFHHLKYAPSTLLSLTESDKHVQTLSHRRAIKNLRQMSCCFPFDYFYYPSFHCEWWFWCSSEKDNCISVQHLSSKFQCFTICFPSVTEETSGLSVLWSGSFCIKFALCKSCLDTWAKSSTNSACKHQGDFLSRPPWEGIAWETSEEAVEHRFTGDPNPILQKGKVVVRTFPF